MKASTTRAMLLAPLVSLCALTGGCNREISTGSFNGLAIGMNKADAFLAARNLGGHLATAIPCGDVVRKDNLNGMPWLDRAEGIRVAEFSGRYTQAYFSVGRVASVESSPNLDSALASLFIIGDDLNTVRQKVTSTLGSRSNMYAHPIIHHDVLGSIDLDAALPNAEGTTGLRDCWKFEVTSVKPAGAYYELTFGQNRLTKISYRRPWIRE
jgi:hypothetical protein